MASVVGAQSKGRLEKQLGLSDTEAGTPGPLERLRRLFGQR